MKIDGWNKINGFTYKGYVIKNADYDKSSNLYYADIANLNDVSTKFTWWLTLTPTNDVSLLKIRDNTTAPKYIVTQKVVTKDTFSSLIMFRMHFEGMVDEMILLTTTHTSNIVSRTTGIVGHTMNSATFVSHSYAPSGTGLSGSSSNNLW